MIRKEGREERTKGRKTEKEGREEERGEKREGSEGDGHYVPNVCIHVFERFRMKMRREVWREEKITCDYNLFFLSSDERKQSFQFTVHTESSWNKRSDWVLAGQSEREMKDWISAFKVYRRNISSHNALV